MAISHVLLASGHLQCRYFPIQRLNAHHSQPLMNTSSLSSSSVIHKPAYVFGMHNTLWQWSLQLKSHTAQNSTYFLTLFIAHHVLHISSHSTSQLLPSKLCVLISLLPFSAFPTTALSLFNCECSTDLYIYIPLYNESCLFLCSLFHIVCSI